MGETNDDRRHRLLTITLLIACVTIPGILFVRDHAYSMYDDAYIYLRYVDNIAHGCGVRWNCSGAPVEGFTSPLYLVLLLLGRVVTTDLESYTQVIGPLLLFAGLIVASLLVNRGELGRTDRRIRLGLCFATALLLATDDFVVLNAVVGLETGLAALVVALLVGAVLDRSERRTQVYLILAVLARPECAIFVLALPLLPWTRRLRFLAPIGVALLAIAVARLAMFGDLLPNTYWAKAGGGARHAELGWAYIVETVELFPLIAFAPLALLRGAARRELAYVIGVAVIWFLFFLRSGGDLFMYGRLAFPLVPALTLLGIYGLWSALSALLARIPRAQDLGTDRQGLVAGVVLLLPLLLSGIATTSITAPRPATGFPMCSGGPRSGNTSASTTRARPSRQCRSAPSATSPGWT